MEEQRMNIEELLLDWDNPKTFKELPYRHLMSECMVTVDEPVKRKNLDELINGVRNKINSGIKNVRRSFEKER
jgi:hypothetical protein